MGLQDLERRMEKERPLRRVMNGVYVLMIILPIVFGAVSLPENLVREAYTPFFQSFIGGSLLIHVMNVMLLVKKGEDFKKKYAAIGKGLAQMPRGDPWSPIATAAGTLVSKWHRRFVGLILLSSASFLVSGILFWILLAGGLYTKMFFLLALLPLLLGLDFLLAAIYHHATLQFIIW